MPRTKATRGVALLSRGPPRFVAAVVPVHRRIADALRRVGDTRSNSLCPSEQITALHPVK